MRKTGEQQANYKDVIGMMVGIGVTITKRPWIFFRLVNYLKHIQNFHADPKNIIDNHFKHGTYWEIIDKMADFCWSGWWFGTFGLFFPYTGNTVIIPTDFHIFQRGRYTTNQWWYWVDVGKTTFLYLRFPSMEIQIHQPLFLGFSNTARPLTLLSILGSSQLQLLIAYYSLVYLM